MSDTVPPVLPPFRGYIEVSPAYRPRPNISHVLFDFDGTLSLVREGWQEIMVPLFVEMLPRVRGDTDDSVTELMREDIARLTGKQTIYQMIQFAERVRARGGTPEEPLWYKNEYLRRLGERIQHRLDGLRSGAIRPDFLLVFGARSLLEYLTRLGVTLYLASGTDERFVKDEAELLDVARYFGPHIYGAQDDYRTFSKKIVIERLLAENAIPGAQLLSFGDGYVEIENTKEVGGLAIAVATDEANNGGGRIDAWKRDRLVGVGADVVIADFRDAPQLLEFLFAETGKAGRLAARSAGKFDHARLKSFPLDSRRSLSSIEGLPVDPASPPPPCPPEIAARVAECAMRIREAQARKATVMLIFGAHLVRNGAQRLMGEMMRRGYLTHLATNGAGTIHDWEYAYLGRSTESVRENVATGTFGTWDETGKYLHLALLVGGIHGEGYGQALGRFIAEEGTTLPEAAALAEEIVADPPHPLTAARADLLHAMAEHGLPPGRSDVPHPWKNLSVLAQAYRAQVTLTAHPGIGYDIISNHPMFHGAAIGRAARIDFQHFAQALDTLDGGVVLSVGSAIMGPQVFEKALSCAHNVRLQEGRPVVSGHSLYVVDLQDGGGWDWTKGEPPKDNPAYYLRFCKSYARMGGAMHYLQCDNVTFLHHLYHALEAGV